MATSTPALTFDDLGVGTELVGELKRSKRFLPSYNANGVKRLVESTNQVIQSTRDLVSQHRVNRTLRPEFQTTLSAQNLLVHHNRRCGLAYLNDRSIRVRQLWWDSDGLIDPINRHNEIVDAMSIEEKAFLQNYDHAIQEFMQSIDLELTTFYKPPRSLWCSVRVLSDAGSILSKDGSGMELRKGSMKRMRTCDAERLCRQGIVEQIKE